VQEEDVYHPISRKFKHSSILVCVSVAYDSLTLLVVNTAPIPDSLWLNDLRPDENFLICHRSPYTLINPHFLEYITHMLVTYVNSVKENPDL
jgi:hypothetical protein